MKPLKIALIGYGKMGKRLEQLAPQYGIEVIEIIHSHSELETSNNLKNAAVCIDFTSPDAAPKTIQSIAMLGIPLVVGTTGWEEKSRELFDFVKLHNSALIYGSNFSCGIQLLTKMLKSYANLFKTLGYELALSEVHHAAKKDSPSGTALLLEYATGQKLPISSLRVGSVVGMHTLLADSPQDLITVSHEAKNRDGFAVGALLAARWIENKKGVYHFSDVFEEVVC